MIFASFSLALHHDGPAPELADKLGLYGWLIGNWEMDAHRPLANGSVARGRAIQDVWYVPPPAAAGDRPATPPLFGTTLRIYDPGIDAWHIIWVDPVGQNHLRQIGRAQGHDIVQEGSDGAGMPVRWRFTEMTPDSFHWIGERSSDEGKSWSLVVEFFARRKTG